MSVNAALSTGLRGMIWSPPDKKLFVADFAQFENRTAAWLAGCEWKLENYRNGVDPYKIAAASLFGVKPEDVDDDQRFVGKVGELSLQYQGGIKAYAKMGKQYGLDLMKVYKPIIRSSSHEERDYGDFCYRMYLKSHAKSKDKLEKPVSKQVGIVADIIKERWRNKHPEITETWQQYQDAALNAALSETGKSYFAGEGKARIEYFCHSIYNKKFLVCKLPDGTPLFYFRPAVDQKGKRGKLRLSYRGRKGRESTYGGKQFENVTQAVQRNALRDAMINLDDEFDIYLHVHDEVVAAVPLHYGIEEMERYIHLLCRRREWNEEIPIEAKGFICQRYRK